MSYCCYSFPSQILSVGTPPLSSVRELQHWDLDKGVWRCQSSSRALASNRTAQWDFTLIRHDAEQRKLLGRVEWIEVIIELRYWIHINKVDVERSLVGGSWVYKTYSFIRPCHKKSNYPFSIEMVQVLVPEELWISSEPVCHKFLSFLAFIVFFVYRSCEFYEHIFMTSEVATVSNLIMQQINQNRFLW